MPKKNPIKEAAKKTNKVAKNIARALLDALASMGPQSNPVQNNNGHNNFTVYEIKASTIKEQENNGAFQDAYHSAFKARKTSNNQAPSKLSSAHFEILVNHSIQYNNNNNNNINAVNADNDANLDDEKSNKKKKGNKK